MTNVIPLVGSCLHARKNLSRVGGRGRGLRSLANIALPAFADGGMGDVFEQSILPGANTALKNVMEPDDAPPKPRPTPTSHRRRRFRSSRVGPVIGLPQGFTYIGRSFDRRIRLATSALTESRAG